MSPAYAGFTVTAAGDPAPTYQWQRNGVDLPGATTPSLTFPSAQTANGGNYAVVVTNAFGSITSNVATLTITGDTTTPPPTQSGSGGGGGGGAPSFWFAALLASVALVRIRRRGRHASTI